MNASEIRKSFLEYFGRNGHAVLPSSSLVPHDDPTLYFTNAGMVQFKDAFTGAEKPAAPRAATAQKCLRVSGKHNDLDNVGRTPRHHTFFEMLGNFSFGDYFKPEAISFAWEMLTGVWKLDAERLWVTVYEEDDEAFALWRERVGVPESRIQRLGAEENFWSMGPVGPCGPCSEIHYDHGEARGPAGGPATGSGRYVEIWNLVFMQFEQHPDKSRTTLPKPSIDTGMGLERVAAALQGVYWNYDTDVFQPLIRRAASLANVKWGAAEESDTALRVIADHARATAFLVADGVMPSNDERGYVLRRLMRRGIMFGRTLGLEKPFLHEVVNEVITGMTSAYPELAERRAFVEAVVTGEEERFRRTLDRGMKLLETEFTTNHPGGTDGGHSDSALRNTLPGPVAFKLHDTYGFPLDLTELIAERRGWGVDRAGFEQEMARQQESGRSAWKGSGEQAVGALWHELHTELGPTRFTGYTHDRGEAKVLAIVRRSGADAASAEFTRVQRLATGERGIVLLDATPFYAESGGQVGDAGRISGFAVADTIKAAGLWLHTGEADEPIEVGAGVEAAVDAPRRDRTRRNHTATHLLHAALRQVLGPHVTQKGSLVGPDRLRFDFSHPQPVTPTELEQIEARVNEQILANQALETDEDDLEHAVARGAMALFGEKYDAKVRVVAIPGFSIELCGGTHARRTGDIGLFRVQSEAGVAAGVRRIEAQTGTGALALVKVDADRLHEAARKLKTEPARLVEAIGRLQDERRAVEKELAEWKREVAKAAAGDLVRGAKEFAGVKVLAAEFDGDLREQADRLRDQLGSSLVVLLSRKGDRVQLIAAASKDVAGSRVHAGKVIEAIAPLVGGRGGGRPDLAQAGGTDAGGIAAAIDRVYTYAAESLGG
ncbi:MAG: alanine--tRNA ligase [Myxococcota bacterium]